MNCCIICKCEETSHYCYSENYEYLQCKDCGLVYLNALPTDEEMHEAYHGNWWKDFRRRLVSPFRKLEHFKIYQEKMASTGEIMDIANKHIQASAGSQMLDIGCNKGFLLTSGVNRGFIPYGVELVPVLMDQFKRKFKQYKQNIYSQFFSVVSKKFDDDSFDLITAIDVIEHLPQPRPEIAEVFRILKKGGCFLIQTCDTTSEEAKELGDNWGALKAHEHLFLFNKENLKIFSEQIGFTKIDFYPPVAKGEGNMLAVLTK